MGRREELISEYWEREINKEPNTSTSKSNTLQTVREELTELVGFGKHPEHTECIVDDIVKLIYKYKDSL